MLYLFEDYVLDTDLHELRQGGAARAVGPQVFDLLLYLLRNRERVASQEDLFGEVWRGRHGLRNPLYDLRLMPPGRRWATMAKISD